MKIPLKMKPHIKKIFSGEYDVDFYTEEPIIVDIGANVGGFTRWAYGRWANSKIFCFEPIKENFKMLQENTTDMNNVVLYNCAVGSSNRKQKMFYGKNNEGESSLFLNEEQKEEGGEEVEVISAKQIPKCHILKIDTEGAEIEIIKNIINHPYVYLIEYHSDENRIKLDKMLSKKYLLLSSNATRINYGIVKYALKEIIK